MASRDVTLLIRADLRGWPLSLGEREAGPHPDPGTYTDLDDYERDWHLWRALDRDARPTRAELETRLGVLLDWATDYREGDRR